jgi:uncharacterized protein YbcV (DUF1398 family)
LSIKGILAGKINGKQYMEEIATMMQEYPIANIKPEDIQRIAQAENAIKTANGKDVVLIAYEKK